jgi:hypothetical protein
LKPKSVRRDKGYFIIIKEIHQEEISVVNLYAPNVGAPIFLKHMATGLKNTERPQHGGSGDFNTPLSPIDRSSRQTSTEYCIPQQYNIHFSHQPMENFSKIDHI